MANLTDWSQFLNGILPLIQMIVAVIESIFSGQSGASKKEQAMSVARVLIPAGPGGASVPDVVLSKAIDAHVDLMNATGGFEHSSGVA